MTTLQDPHDFTPAVDVAAWIGSYPFRGIAHHQPGDLARKCVELNIERAIVSPFDGIFWENNLDAFDLWLPRVADFPQLELWPVVNPAFPGQLDQLVRLLDRASPAGLRLLPNYHGYRLWDPTVTELMALARERRLIVQVFQRIADERWHWMLRTSPVDEQDLDHLTACYTQQPIILSAVNAPARFASRSRQHPHLYLDISRVRGPVFAVEKLVPVFPVERLLFGSLWPIQIPEATLWQLHHAPIDEAARDQILGGNARRLLAAVSQTQRDVEGPWANKGA